MANNHHHRKPVVSPELALASDLFDKFCGATTLKTILSHYRSLCEILHMKPTNFPQFYPKLKSKLCSWRAQALWNKFDKRANHKCYNRGKACPNTRVLIIGAGPCGLRAAIEAQLLGAKVVVIEKRDRISRNNVLHLWPFVIHDLRSLGAKKFFGKFCAGSIDHISIRQLQCILLKVALLLGVEIHEGISFESLVPPSSSVEERVGWRAKIMPEDHPVSQYEFDVLIGADGKRNTLDGFKRKEFRGKLAIAITANFINYHSEAEARVEEISGVAYIFNQKFFKDLRQATGIDLENIVYYKDDTHYFVMTAKKHSLLNKGVILNDYADTAKLLAIENISKEALMEYAREAADFSSGYKLPQLQFAVNHYGQPDVAMFDFTSMYAAENASRVVQEKGYKLLMCLVGDSLLEPFWPTGSGCARGFLSSMDACWVIRSWGSSSCVNPLEVLAERESIYRLLNQSTPENLSRDIANYMLDPHTRYPNLNTRSVLPIQVKGLFVSDDPAAIEVCLKAPSLVNDYSKKRRRKDTQIHHDVLLSWLKRQVALYNDLHIENTNKSFKDGLALCAIIHRYRPDLIDFHSLNSSDVSSNNQLAFDILEKEYGILPVMTGLEMKKCDVPDNLTMLSYLTQVYDIFRGEIPYTHHRKKDDESILNNLESTPGVNQSLPYKASLSKLSHSQKLTLLSRISGSIPRKRYRESRSPTSTSKNNDVQTIPRKPKKRKSGSSAAFMEQRKDRFERARREQPQMVNGKDDHQGRTVQQRQTAARIAKSRRMLEENKRDNGIEEHHGLTAQQRLTAARIAKSRRMLEENKREEIESTGPFEDYTMFVYRQNAPDFKVRVQDLERKLCHPDREPKELPEFKKNPMEENFSGRVKDIETKLKEGNKLEKKPKDLLRAIGKIEKTDWNIKEIEKKIEENKHGRGMTSSAAKVPKWNRQQFDDKFTAVKKKLIGKETAVPDQKYANVDNTLKRLDQKLKNGTVLEQGQRGANKVSAMAAQLSTRNQQSDDKSMTKSGAKNVVICNQGGSEICHFCNKRVYLMERLNAEGRFFHRGCFRCEYCGISLRLGNYNFDRDGKYGSRFYCSQHFGFPGVYRTKQKNKLNDNKNGLHNDEPPKTPTSLKMQFLNDSTDTPERLVFENLDIDTEETGNVSINEMDEDEWTDHNFGASANELASSDDVSEISESDEEDNEDEFAQALDIPSIDNNESLEFTRRFTSNSLPCQAATETAHRKNSHGALPDGSSSKCKLNHNKDSDSSCSEEEHNISYHEFESEEESNVATGERAASKSKGDGVALQNVCLKIPERPTAAVSDSGSETEVASDEYSSDNDYDDSDDDDDDEDDDEDDDDDDSDSDSDDDSATEISTDSEFERNIGFVTKSEIPDIVISESLPTRRGQLEEIRTIQVISKNIPEKSTARWKNTEDRPPPKTVSTTNHEATGEQRRPLVNPQRGDYYLNRTQSTEGVASKISLELKKKYLFGGDSSNHLVKKSDSTSVLDTKFKSLVDQISEHQKLLNFVPEPSQTMQTLLETTDKLRNSGPAPISPTNSTAPNLRKSKELTGLDDFPHVCHSSNFDSINEALIGKNNNTSSSISQAETDTSHTTTTTTGGPTVVERPASPIFETSIVVPEFPKIKKTKSSGPATVDGSSSSEASCAEELEEDDHHHDSYQKKAQALISLPKVEIHNSQGELLPQDIEVDEVKIRNSQMQPEDEKRTRPATESSVSKIMAMPVSDLSKERDAQILKHVSTPAELFISSGDPPSGGSKNSSFSDKSSPSTPTSLQGDDNTLAVFTETELSDWARDEDGAVSENFDDLILGTPNITYRRHQKPKKRAGDSGGAAGRNTKSRAKKEDLRQDDFVHVCGKNDKLKPASFALANLDGMDIEFMDTGEDDPAGDNGAETVNPMFLKNSGYIEYVTSEDEAKTPLAEAINSSHPSFDNAFVEDVSATNIFSFSPAQVNTTPEPIHQADDYDKFVHRLQERITSFGNVKDSIDIRKLRKSPKHSPPEESAVAAAEAAIALAEAKSKYTPTQKLEELSRERSKQKNLIHEMVMSKLQSGGKSMQERKAKRSYRNSLSPFNSTSQNSLQSEAGSDDLKKVVSSEETISNKENIRENCRLDAQMEKPSVVNWKVPAPVAAVSDKYSESYSLPDIRKALSDLGDKPVVPASPAKLEILKSTESIRQQAKTRARLMSDSELGLSPEDKLKLLKQKIAARKAVQSAYVDYPKSQDYLAEKTSYSNKMLDALNKAIREADVAENSDEVTLPPRGKGGKDKDRRKSIIQAVSDFFLKKSPTKDSPSKDSSSPSSSSSNRLKFKIPLMGKEKSKVKSPVDETVLQPAFISESNLKKKGESLVPPRPPSPVGYAPNLDLDKSDENLSVTTIDSHDEYSTLSTSKNLRTSHRRTKRENQKKLRMAQEIQRQLEEIEVKQKELEFKGVNVEKALRNNQNLESEFELMQELLDMIRERNELRKYEQKLLLKAKEIEAEDPYLH